MHVKASELGLPLVGPETAVGIRVTAGRRQFCALIDGATIRQDDADRFIAKTPRRAASPIVATRR